MPSLSSPFRRLMVFLDGPPVLPDGPVVEDASAPTWPFRRHVVPASPPAAGVIWIRDLHLAFPSGQAAGTRLVLTQSTYQLQRWLDWLDGHPDVRVVADADRRVLGAEARAGRGPWSRIDAVDSETEAASANGGRFDLMVLPAGGEAASHALHAAFSQTDPQQRLAVCQRAVESAPEDPALLVALGSVFMELQVLDEAHATLQRAVAAAPEWEAPHFELGKLLLRTEDTDGAAAAFAEAARLMPSFAAALSNLGAALGELGRPEQALEALEQALQVDPRGHPVLNNLGSVYREEGRLDDAEGAFRQVIALAPSFVFGYYNLGHTLFLKGSFEEARRAYEEGFARDPQKNARQAARLAIARAAVSDSDGAIQLLEKLGSELPPERTRGIFEEAESTLEALSAITGIDAAALARVRAVLARYSS